MHSLLRDTLRNYIFSLPQNVPTPTEQVLFDLRDVALADLLGVRQIVTPSVYYLLVPTTEVCDTLLMDTPDYPRQLAITSPYGAGTTNSLVVNAHAGRLLVLPHKIPSGIYFLEQKTW